MRKIILLIICLYLGGVIMSYALDQAEENIFKLTSTSITNNETLPNEQVYKGYGCDGGNLSPQLSWINVPKNAKSYALICHDPDAPRPNGWYHWLVINIPSNINSIDAGGKIENAKEMITDFSTAGYGGACPPKGHGIHHYNFTVYALDIEKIDAPDDIKPKELEEKILAHAIAKSTITALYERK